MADAVRAPSGRARRWPIRLGLAFLVAGALYWLVLGGRADDGRVLHVGSQRGGTKAMMLASGALEGARYRVEWSEFPAAQHLLEALGAGAVDVGAVGDAPFQFAYQSGSPIKAVQATLYGPRNAASAVLVTAASPIRAVADLRGKRVATGRGSAGHDLLLRVLAKAGIPPGDLTIVFLPPGDAKAAFASGSIDAWVTWNPYVGSAVLHDGARVIADGRDYDTSYGFMVASDAAIADKRAILADFLVRNARAEAWASAHTDGYAKVLAAETGLPLDVAHYTADRALSAVPTDAKVLTAQRRVLALFRQAGATPGSRPLDKAFDTSFDRDLAKAR